MARNPFEQLQDLVSEPRQEFEDIVTRILKCLYPNSRRVRVYRGDGGIDAFTGTLGDEGEANVYQVKYFPTAWGDAQKRQIREAYETARNSVDYQLGVWTLCVPTRLSKEDLRWFDEWRGKLSGEVILMDGDDLTRHLNDPRCANVRGDVRKLGVHGVTTGGPQFTATALFTILSPERTGISARIIVRVANVGELSARSLKITVKHSETVCVAERETEDWEMATTAGILNPRVLRYRHTLNSGDVSMVMGIPICDKTPFPVSVPIKLTAEDCRPSELFCQLTAEQITLGAPVLFGDKRFASDQPIPPASEKSKIVPPTSPAGNELLQMILDHPVAQERGLTEILRPSHQPMMAHFIPNTTAAGCAPSFKKSVLRAAITELIQLGWLLPPEEDDVHRVYELNPDAPRSI